MKPQITEMRRNFTVMICDCNQRKKNSSNSVTRGGGRSGTR
jgi:hypothetical protein